MKFDLSFLKPYFLHFLCIFFKNTLNNHIPTANMNIFHLIFAFDTCANSKSKEYIFKSTLIVLITLLFCLKWFIKKINVASILLFLICDLL